MAIDKETVKYLAHLARIDLGPEELEKLSLQLQEILDFIDSLAKINTSSVLPTSHILALNNVFREDIPKKSLSSEQALTNAPSPEGNFFVAPKVIE